MGAKREAQKIAQAIRHRQNAERVVECQCSGLSVTAWCEKQGITKTTYYRWQRQAREEALIAMKGNGKPAELLVEPMESPAMLPAPRFSELPAFSQETVEAPGTGAAIRIQIGGAVVEIQKETDARLAESVVRALAKLC